MDYTGGDLYEAEELFQLFVRYLDGKVIQPVAYEKGKNFGCLRCLLNTVKSASIKKTIQRGGTLNPILDYTVSGQQNEMEVLLTCDRWKNGLGGAQAPIAIRTPWAAPRAFFMQV